MGSGSRGGVSSGVSIVWVIEDEFLFSIELLEGIFSGKGLINGSGTLESVEEDSGVGEASVSDSSDSIAIGGNSSDRDDSSIASVGLPMGTGSSSMTNGRDGVGGSTFSGTEILGLMILLATSRDNSPLTN